MVQFAEGLHRAVLENHAIEGERVARSAVMLVS
jgi:hypothetical protein